MYVHRATRVILEDTVEGMKNKEKEAAKEVEDGEEDGEKEAPPLRRYTDGTPTLQPALR